MAPCLAPADTQVTVRAVRDVDLPAMEGLGKGWPGLHAYRHAEQESGESLYLVAFCEGQAVAHVLLTWRGAPSPPLPHPLESCPDISDLFVDGAFRRRGIGESLVGICEAIAADAGYEQIGLGVALDNETAQALYAKRGYVEAGQEPFWEEGEWVDSEGTLRSWREPCRYLIKPLVAAKG